MRRLLDEDSGFTLVELIITTALTLVVVGTLSNLFVSGLRAGSNAGWQLTSQSSVRLAFDRLEYEARCAQTATRAASGADVTLYLPPAPACAHAQGTYTWCVSGGALTRYTGSSCSGTGQTFIRNVTTPTPFSCVAPVNQYPRLQIALTVNGTSASANRFSATDQIDMHNAALTTSSASACT
jgi:Tfp pilus assembly protein PilW